MTVAASRLLEQIGALRQQLVGEVHSSADEAYKAATHPFTRNALKATTQALPVCVIKPRNTRDVATAVKFARTNSFSISVKGGGHGVRNDWLVDDVLLLDMSLMRGVYVDASEKYAVVEGGCTLEDIDAATSMHKLAVPLGTFSPTGVGLALNGGFGIMAPKYGPTCDSVLAFTLVTAEGEVVEVSEKTRPDLFWAMRGAGSAFGVVTHIKFRLYDVSHFYGGSFALVDDAEHKTYKALMHFMTGAARTSFEMGGFVARMVHPEQGPMIMGMLGLYGDEPEESKAEFMAPLRALGPVMDTIGKASHYEMQCTFTPNMRATPPEAVAFGYWTHFMLMADQVSDEVLDKFCAWRDKTPPGGTLVAWAMEPRGGAVQRTVSPLGGTQEDVLLAVFAHWPDPSLTTAFVEFLNALKADMAAHCSAAQYPNYDTGDDKGYHRLVARVGGEANLLRIRKVKAAWDPDNMFCHHPFDGLVPAPTSNGC